VAVGPLLSVDTGLERATRCRPVFESIPVHLYVEDDAEPIPVEDFDDVLEADHSGDGPETEITSIQKICGDYDWNVELADSELGGARFECYGSSFQ
jgi:hypothetical protein